MNALDIATILIVVIFTGLGLYQGLIKSVSSLAAILGGLVLAKRFSAEVTRFLCVIQVADARGVLGLLLAFLVFFVAIKILLHFTQKIVNTSVLAPFDLALGGLFGLAKGVIVVLMTVALFQVVLPKNSAILVGSKTLPVTQKAVVIVTGLLPEHMRPYIQQTKRILLP